MIEAKTLLIVGAGASVPYGYPTGVQLKNGLYNPQNLTDLTRYRVHSKGIELFCQHFRESQQDSIDAFLATRGRDRISENPSGVVSFGNYEDCGKLAIAHQLIKSETSSNLFEPAKDENGNPDHWLQYLWKQINSDASKTEFQNNQLKIVSFNYDRVLEHYFQTTIERTYGINSMEATELRKTIEIVHAYGNLQDLENRPYGSIPADLSEVAACIRVIPEDRTADDVQFKKAKEMIGWADRICFIGFGFDKTNTQRLGFHPDHDYGQTKKFYSTQYGMKRPEVDKAQRLLGSRFVVGEHRELTTLKTLEYLRETGFFEYS